MSAETSNGDDSNHQTHGEQITSPAQIVRLLERVKESRELLTITIPGVDNIYSSAILGISSEQKYLLLDKLFPADGHGQLINAAEFYVFTRLKGVEIHFASRVLDVGNESEGAYYRVMLPQVVDHKQRRDSYRIQLSVVLGVSVTIWANAGTPLEGWVCNLSAGGFGAYMNSNVRLSRGQVFPRCTIRLPDDKHITTPIEIRYVGHDEQTGSLRIGARFLELRKSERNTLERFIMALERELIRKMPKN